MISHLDRRHISFHFVLFQFYHYVPFFFRLVLYVSLFCHRYLHTVVVSSYHLLTFTSLDLFPKARLWNSMKLWNNVLVFLDVWSVKEADVICSTYSTYSHVCTVHRNWTPHKRNWRMADHPLPPGSNLATRGPAWPMATTVCMATVQYSTVHSILLYIKYCSTRQTL